MKLCVFLEDSCGELAAPGFELVTFWAKDESLTNCAIKPVFQSHNLYENPSVFLMTIVNPGFGMSLSITAVCFLPNISLINFSLTGIADNGP